MPILDTAVVAAVTGLDAANGGVEKALLVEDDAAADARLVLSPYVAEVVEDPADDDYTANYAAFRRAVARLAFARVAPTMGSFRPTSGGGFQRASGPESARVEFLSPRQVRELAAELRDQALGDLAALRLRVEERDLADALVVTPALYIC